MKPGLLFILTLLLLACEQTEELSSGVDSVSAVTMLGGDSSEAFAKADRVIDFVFPQDHGPHPEFRTEWWYVTGNLEAEQGQRFGYQITLFRIAAQAGEVNKDSAWRSKQLYMGHFAITDIAGRQHYAFERFARSAAGLAGAQAKSFKVWLEDWSMRSTGELFFPLQIRATEQDMQIDFTLQQGKSLVLQGDKGLSQKSAAAGNASYYYSYTRLPTTGVLTINGQQYQVFGNSWLDREWSTSALDEQQTGWDWFALQFDDGRELMYYRLRGKDQATDPHSSGVLVAIDGQSQPLAADDVTLTVLEQWRSPETQHTYPISWRLQVPAHALDIEVSAQVQDQEMRLTVSYWEGAVAVAGTAADKPLTGRGYLEMTTYRD